MAPLLAAKFKSSRPYARSSEPVDCVLELLEHPLVWSLLDVGHFTGGGGGRGVGRVKRALQAAASLVRGEGL